MMLIMSSANPKQQQLEFRILFLCSLFISVLICVLLLMHEALPGGSRRSYKCSLARTQILLLARLVTYICSVKQALSKPECPGLPVLHQNSIWAVLSSQTPPPSSWWMLTPYGSSLNCSVVSQMSRGDIQEIIHPW